jgi:hypothetical protein
MENPKEILIARREAEERVCHVVQMMVRRDIHGTMKRENDAHLMSSVAAVGNLARKAGA